MDIKFWKDRTKGTIEPTLFSDKAEFLAKELANEGKRINKRTQIRKFYDEVVRLDMESKTRDWDNILPIVNMLIAKAAYAKGRDLVSDNFLNFIKNSVKQISDKKDLSAFANFFEAFMGFYRLHRPSD
ncbi:MAG: type III-A CRISPR-associated protein Csm2 [Desulfobacterales bacterium]|nr:type III-A CRISPR-associated protein Csm2 [Desulfobacterales bacterium]